MICWYFDSADLRIWGDASGLYSTIDAKEWSECPYLGMRSPFPRSHPSRGAWIEINCLTCFGLACRSHPSRGAWIEIWLSVNGSRAVCGRTPHGVRGLKSQTKAEITPSIESHPSRGAWIEMWSISARRCPATSRTPHGVRGLKLSVQGTEEGTRPSHPSRGAWIEMTSHACWPTSASRTPHGVRGLKYAVHA